MNKIKNRLKFKLLAATFALAAAFGSLGVQPASAQPYPPGPPPPGYGRPPGPPPGFRPPPPWHRGGYYRGGRHWADWRYYHLRRPPYGYEWVRDRGQFLLIRVDNGIIIDIH